MGDEKDRAKEVFVTPVERRLFFAWPGFSIRPGVFITLLPGFGPIHEGGP